MNFEFLIKREITAPKKSAILLPPSPPLLSLSLFPVAPFLSLLRNIFIFFIFLR